MKSVLERHYSLSRSRTLLESLELVLGGFRWVEDLNPCCLT